MRVFGMDVSDRLNCCAFNDAIFALVEERHFDVVILAAQWARFNTDIDALTSTLSRMTAMGVEVIVLGPGPFYDTPVPVLLAQLKMAKSASDSAENHLIPELGSVDACTRHRLASIVGVSYISVLDAFCAHGGCPLATLAGVPVHWDSTHLTTEGADLVLSRIGPVLSALGLKPNQRIEQA